MTEQKAERRRLTAAELNRMGRSLDEGAEALKRAQERKTTISNYGYELGNAFADYLQSPTGIGEEETAERKRIKAALVTQITIALESKTYAIKRTGVDTLFDLFERAYHYHSKPRKK